MLQTKFFTHTSELSIQKNVSETKMAQHLILETFKKETFESNECFLQLPQKDLSNLQIKIKKYQQTKLKLIIVVGIGGSNLGTQAIYEALRHKTTLKEILFLDTLSQEHFDEITKKLQKCQSEKEFLIISISKSGTTLETSQNTKLILEFLKKIFPLSSERLVYITSEKSPLHLQAKKDHIDVITFSPLVGGRWSVFSEVGLFPLALCGINIQELLNGAKFCNQQFQQFPISHISTQFSSHLFELMKDRSVLNFFFFEPELECLGKWLRQLFAESLGKKECLNKEKNLLTIIPQVSIGSVDLHSMQQLYVSLPDLFIHHFFSCTKENSSIQKTKNAIIKAVKLEYKQQHIPIFETTFDEISEKNLGQLMQEMMISVFLLSKLLNINAFNQPEVEGYKKELRKFMAN